MKKTIFICTLLLCFQWAYAQNNQGKADDASRIALTSIVSPDIQDMSNASRSFLVNKLNRIASRYGMGSSAMNDRFIITANVEVLTKDITPTAPPMHAYTLEVSLYIGDGIDGKLFASTSKTVKGVGTTRTKAYKAALKNIKSSDPRYKAFLEEGKNKIMQYYNSQCDFIIKEAQMLASRKEYDAAIYKLVSIPKVCKESYVKAMDAVAPIYQKKIDDEATKLLADARNAWSAGLNIEAAQEASLFLSQIDPQAKCFGQAEQLTQTMAKRIKEIDQREWDFKLKKQQDKIDLEKATVEAAKEIGVAYATHLSHKEPNQYKGWW